MKTAACVLVFVSCVAVPAFGQNEYRVNSTRDALDRSPGDRICSTGRLVDGVPECTLRGALQEINAPGFRRGGRILLPRGTYFLTRGTEPGDQSGATEDFLQRFGVGADIAVRTRDLDIGTDVFIEGEGPGLTIIDGTSSDRVFHIVSSLRNNQGFFNLTIRRGFVEGRRGGCILREGTDGLFTLGNVVLEHCLAVGNEGGAVYNAGAVIFAGSIVRNATASLGGGLHNIGVAQINDSTFMHNGGQSTFGIQGRGGAIYNGLTRGGEAASLLVRNSALIENAATVGGALYNEGGATILNSTVSTNQAGIGGGLMFAHRPGGTLWVATSTIANNTGEGIRRATANPLHLRETILAGNILNPSGLISNCVGGVTTSSESLEDANTCGLVGAGDLPNTDPLLGPLANNGGLTMTHAIPGGSPAVDAAGVASESRDQRGLPRPVGAAADIGAYEFGFDPAFTIIDVPIHWEDLFAGGLPMTAVGFSATLSLSGPERRNYYNEGHFTGVKPAAGQSQLKVEFDPARQAMRVSGVTSPPKADFNVTGKKGRKDRTVLFYVSVQRPLRGVSTLRIRETLCACDAKPIEHSRIPLPPFKLKDVQ